MLPVAVAAARAAGQFFARGTAATGRFVGRSGTQMAKGGVRTGVKGALKGTQAAGRVAGKAGTATGRAGTRAGEGVTQRTGLQRATSAYRFARDVHRVRGMRKRRRERRKRRPSWQQRLADPLPVDKFKRKLKKRRRRIVVMLLLAFVLMFGGLFGALFLAIPQLLDGAAVSAAAQQQSLQVGGVCIGMDPAQVQQRTSDLGTQLGNPESQNTDIPPEAFAAYCSAAAAYQMDWALLAAVGWIECKNGQAQAAGCNPRGSVNAAGARGPMQHLGNTWDASRDRFEPDVRTQPVPKGMEDDPTQGGFATDGDGDGWADPWDWADAAYGAARAIAHYSQRLGDWGRAVEGYNAGPGNSAPGYRDAVQRMAAEYRRVTADIAGHPGVPVEGGRKVTTADGQTITVVTMTDLAGQPLRDGRGRPVEVNLTIAPRVQALFQAAEQDLGGDLTVVSSFRDAQTQIELYEGCQAQNGGSCPGTVAEPGTSMHEQGRAIDFGCASTGFIDETTPCFRWLEQNAARYGLQVLQWRRGDESVEPWHWSDNGH